ncbi:MAG: DUF402 domain-containing protein [Acholeplasmataceae bacterium]
MKLSTGMKVPIHSYKHNQRLHRIWRRAIVLYQDDSVLVTANNRTHVIENNGRSWNTREPAICYFYSELWFNIIAMLKPDGVYYYCNLSSPYLYDGEAIKYIDYDLDVKVYPDGTYRILDRYEYEIHGHQMSYPTEIKAIIESQLKDLIRRIERKEAPFTAKEIEQFYEQYKRMSEPSEKR